MTNDWQDERIKRKEKKKESENENKEREQMKSSQRKERIILALRTLFFNLSLVCNAPSPPPDPLHTLSNTLAKHGRKLPCFYSILFACSCHSFGER
jgi:hypothetical protein